MELALLELVRPRSAQIGSPMPRMPPPPAAWSATKRAQAGMIRAGLRPDVLHVDEMHVARPLAERLAQQLELARSRP